MLWIRFVVIALTMAVLGSGCAQPQPAGGDVSAPRQAAAQKKRVVAAMMEADLTSMSVTSGGSGSDSIEFIVHAGLAQVDPANVLHPQLAEAVPTIENGLWKLLPDGRMETTWKIRPDARWHDGQPVAAEDAVFTSRLQQDRDLALVQDPGFPVVEAVTAPDPTTLMVTWRRPYILADSMFGHPTRLLPRHILEQPYQEDKTRLLAHPYWTHGFVGAGPFKLRELQPASHIVLEAFDGYVLGRPRLDELEIRFIPDPATLVANILAGAVELTLGRNVSPDQAAQSRDQWREGQIVTTLYPGSSVGMYPQQMNPSLPALKDPRFRKALLHTMDREEIVQTIMFGQAAVAHTNVPPALIEFEQIQSSIVRYEYDLRQAGQSLEALGFHRGSSGVWEDGSGQRVGFEHRVAGTASQEIQRGVIAATDYWQRAGLGVEQYQYPRGLEASVVADFPGVLTKATGGDVSALYRYFHSSFNPVAENRFSGAASARYVDPQLDALLDRWFTAVPRGERAQALGGLVRYQTENAIWMGYFYNPQISWLNNRLRNVTPTSYVTKGFNAHLWDLA